MNAKPEQGTAPQEGSAETGPDFHARLRAMGGSSHHPFNADLLSRLSLASWPVGDEPEARATTAHLTAISEASLRAFGPADEVEGMLAAQAIALHHAAMAALQRTTLGRQSDPMLVQLWREAANLSGAMVEATNALDRRRTSKEPQP